MLNLKECKVVKTVSILISGRVQGVFFRKYTIITAEKFGIKGFVKNTHNGKVYIEASGDESVIGEFVEWCQKGSTASKVEKVEVNELEPGKYTGFKIRYE